MFQPHLLHGHLHQTATAQLTSPDGAATILACGACYKTRKSPNMYNWVQLELTAGTGTVYSRRYSDARGGFWAPDTLTYRNASNGEYTCSVRDQPAARPPVQDLAAGLHVDPGDPPYAALRALLLETFTSDELRRFCQERAQFYPVLSNIGSVASPNEIIDALFELCRTRHRWGELLVGLVLSRPEQVARDADRLRAESP